MKKFFERFPWAQQAGCGVLVCALLLSICLPLMGMRSVEPDNPILQAAPQEITVLQAGQAPGHAGNGEAESTGAAGSGGSADSELTGEQEQFDSEETENQTEQGQDTQPEQQPESKPQQEVLADAAIGTNTDSNKGDEGEEAGDTGETDEDLPETELDLGALLTWYKYGSQASSMVCAPGDSVGKRVLLAQLDRGRLRYELNLTGLDAEDAKITDVQVAVGNGVSQKADTRGVLDMTLPDGAEFQNYILTVQAHATQKNQKGETVETDVNFAFVLRLESGIDLDLQLTWQPNGQATCPANGSVNRTVKSDTLTDGNFAYALQFLGENADDATIRTAEYWATDGERGALSESGEIQMAAADGKDTETYYFAVTAEVLGQTISYAFVVTYEDGLDLQLQFTWYEKSVTAQQVLCDADKRAALTIKHNQINNSELLYKLGLTGRSAQDAQITSASFNGAAMSTDSGSVRLEATDSGATYTALVTAKVKERTVNFAVTIRYQSDVSLEMAYTVMEDGAAKPCVLKCENRKTVHAEDVYDNQLTDGSLGYELRLTGEDTSGIEITSVTCYQSGDFSTKTLTAPTGSVTLLLAEDGKTGENTFTIKASGAGEEYTFIISIPYKHRGDQEVKIECDLEGVESVANGQMLTFKLRAWSEDAEQNKTYILYTGTDTKLSVKMDDEACIFTGVAGGSWQQFKVTPSNPEKGDTNEHTLVISAEDAFGNKGEKTILLRGERASSGEKLGEATIVIDMGVVGLGSSSITCDVLAGEPASCAVAKAVWGYTAPEPFGTAERSLGWRAECNDPFGPDFYLRSLDDTSGLGMRANAISGSWSGTEEENFARIDAQFGEGTNLDILWRCIYRNSLSLNDASSSLGELDFTEGSGWEYEINGTYPSYGMDKADLKPGDTLTLRYTLAYGWDIGNGQGRGNSVGYCVTYYGGGRWSEEPHHDLQAVTTDGITKQICKRCGLENPCTHPKNHQKYVDQENGTCALVCGDCGKNVGDPAPHVLQYTSEENSEVHIITCQHDCGYKKEEPHIWKEISNTASCEHGGIRTDECQDCHAKRETEEPEPLEHEIGDVWYSDGAKHYQKCKNCGTHINEAEHHYVEGEYDWVCDKCKMLHMSACNGIGEFRWDGSEVDADGHTLYCKDCRLSVKQVHDQKGENGACSVCGYGSHVCEEHKQYVNNGDGTHKVICSVCQKVLTENEAHTYANGFCACGEPEPASPGPNPGGDDGGNPGGDDGGNTPGGDDGGDDSGSGGAGGDPGGGSDSGDDGSGDTGGEG